MRWDIAVYVLLLVGIVVYLNFNKIKVWLTPKTPPQVPATTSNPATPATTPTPSPAKTPAKTAPSTKWWQSGWTIISLLVILSFVGVKTCSNKGMEPPTSGIAAGKPVPAPTPTPVPTSATITLTKADGWVPIKVLCTGGTSQGINVTPPTTEIAVKTPDGKLRYAGYKHEYDQWGTFIRFDAEWQTWLVKIVRGGDNPTTVTVIWGK